MYQIRTPNVSIMAALLAVLLVSGSLVHASDPMAAPDLMPVKMLRAPKHAPVELVREGEPRAVIYLGEVPLSNNLRTLVLEMVESIRLSTGATLPIVLAAPPADQPVIVIGECDETRKARIDAAKIPVDGFVVKTASNRVYLVGSSQPLPAGSDLWAYWANDGTAWAVADFLERFVGVRWYWPLEAGGRSVVKNPTLAIPPSYYTDAPVFRMRTHWPPDGYGSPWQSVWFDPAEKQPPFPVPAGTKTLAMQPLLACLRSGNSWPYMVKCHAPQQLWKKDGGKWAVANKEMFALNGNGSRNYSLLCYSAPETLKYLLDGCEAQWDKKDNGVFASWVTSTCVTVSPFDMPVNCFCPACRAKLAEGRAAHMDASLLLAEFVEKLAKEVQRRWPDKKVIYLPYWNYATCPPNQKLPSNVMVMYCNNNGQGMAAMRHESIRAVADRDIQGWSAAIGAPITTWEYSLVTVGWTHAPMQFPHVVQNHYRRNRGQLTGSFINGGMVCEWSKIAPTMYVWMRVLWNPDIDVEVTLDELCRRQFGPAGKTARELLTLMTDRWENARWTDQLGGSGHLADSIFLETWPPEVVARMAALWDKARLEVRDDPEARARLDYWLWTVDAFIAEAKARAAKQ
jgi:hypothetical protein